ncbi:catechol 2,3-dioxygenase-like lactoylglutathione lyase family enzyme [Pararhizobium capsulatum DSM 1112]|uniref:Catechol 2,3-dioxygenase-like lactoylglutathione lyase family enzyme n=1 Tax=Pararhizobium capsulatum DSM 1112 TaxID=1121113 RepID=A0ABU0C0F4_9HYPH|nr:VOC family protein [Pararhizobium capsulatum]MDQ0324003.1 catechol 2,3-dioxygenase-like lactoylglutathione lyase family enzyme [Pararhizobium capsulatum DSM 1112]
MTFQEPVRRTANSLHEIDTKLEVVVIPVSDVDRAKSFYTGLGWRLDADVPGQDGFRVVQVTPPGSHCSVIFGSKVTVAEPGSAQGLHLIVSDIDLAHAALGSRGAEISGVFHDSGGLFHRGGTEGRLAGPHPSRTSYGSFASFSDPDGNGWLLQEVTTRLPGRIDQNGVTFASMRDLASALRRVAAAHGEHEKRTGGNHDENWPDWYAEYLTAEQSGGRLPT